MKLELIVAKRFLNITCVNDCVVWAEGLLLEGVDSDNVAILAGLDSDIYPDSAEVETYFQKSLKELGLTLPSEKESVVVYAHHLCEQVVSCELEPEAGVKLLSNLYPATDYEEVYGIWDILEDDLWSVNYREKPVCNYDLTFENKYEYIKKVAAQFIKLLESNLPETFFDLKACSQCGCMGDAEYVVCEKSWLPDKLFIFLHGRSKCEKPVCPECKKEYPHSMYDYQGRKLYLDNQQN